MLAWETAKSNVSYIIQYNWFSNKLEVINDQCRRRILLHFTAALTVIVDQIQKPSKAGKSHHLLNLSS